MSNVNNIAPINENHNIVKYEIDDIKKEYIQSEEKK